MVSIVKQGKTSLTESTLTLPYPFFLTIFNLDSPLGGGRTMGKSREYMNKRFMRHLG